MKETNETYLCFMVVELQGYPFKKERYRALRQFVYLAILTLDE